MKLLKRDLTVGVGTIFVHTVNTFTDTTKKLLEAYYLIFSLIPKNFYFCFFVLFKLKCY